MGERGSPIEDTREAAPSEIRTQIKDGTFNKEGKNAKEILGPEMTFRTFLDTYKKEGGGEESAGREGSRVVPESDPIRSA